MKLWREIVWLLMLAAVPAIFTAWLHPRRPEWSANRPSVEQVEVDVVLRWGTQVLWVDARQEQAYAQRHIPGATLLNETNWESLLPGFLKAWQPGIRVVIYCDSRECNSSEEVAARLKRELNLADIYVLKGGWSSWEQSHR